jgi:hypothetical protein
VEHDARRAGEDRGAMIRHSPDVTSTCDLPSHDPCATVGGEFVTLASRLARWTRSLAATEPNGHVPGDRDSPAAVVGLTACKTIGSSGAPIGPLSAAAATVFSRGVLVVESDPACATWSQWPRPLGADRNDPRHEPLWLADSRQGDGVERIEHTGHSHVWLLRAAQPLRDPFGVDALWARLQALRGSYGLLLVDLPPAGESEQGRTLAGLLDGVLLVVEAERTPARVAQRVKDQLSAAGARLLGVVLTGTRQHLPPWLDQRLP